MVSHKKRKISHLSNPNPNFFQPLPSYIKQQNQELTTSFEKFEDAMCDLLASASVVTSLQGVLGDEKANFIFALQHMIATGDLSWVKEIDSDGEEVMNVTEEAVNDMGTTDDRVAHAIHTPTTTEGSPPEKLSGIWPPPLPPIPNPSLRLQVFTPSMPGNEDQPHSHYQRLEWLGDAYLEAAISRILYDRFPDAREGPLTVMRQHLVTNKFLSHLATLYGFENRITGISDLPSTIDGVKKTDIYWKMLADCFEAYVAAVVISDPRNTLETLINWLAPLYEPEISRNQDLTQGPIPKLKIQFPMAKLVRRPEFRRMRNPGVVEHPARRLQNARAKSRSLPPRTIRRCSARLVAMGPRVPIIIDETESDWEEIENPEKVAKSPTRIPLDDDAPTRTPPNNNAPTRVPLNDNAKIHLRSILSGDGVTLDFVRTSKSRSPPGGEQQGYRFNVTALLTGWGFINLELGSGCGATEYEAGQRAAMAALKDKDLLIRLKQQKAGESVELSPLSLESSIKGQLHQPIFSTPTYNPGPPTQTTPPWAQGSSPLVIQPPWAQGSSPLVIQNPWALPSVWGDMGDICVTGPVQESKFTTYNAVKSASVIQLLREDLHDLIMVDYD